MEKENRKREFCRRLQGYKSKFSKESYRKTKQCDDERPRKKKFKKAKKGGRNWKTRRDKKYNMSMEEEQKEEIKRQRRHSKRENVEKVFLVGKVKRVKKGSYKLSKHNFSMKKQFFSEEEKNRKKEKTQRNISLFGKKWKRETNEKHRFFFHKKKKTVKTERIQKILFFLKKWSIQIEKIKKGRKRIIKSKGIFTPRKFEKKGQ